MLLALWLAVAAAPPAEGVVAGQLTIVEDRKPVSLARVQEVLRAPVVVELRKGRQVIAAELSPDGLFIARAPPGRYRLEYLGLGRRAEFFTAQELVVRPGTLLCAGTLSLAVPRLESLGESRASRIAIASGCARMLPRLKELAGWEGKTAVWLAALAPPDEVPREITFPDLLLGLRAEVSFNGYELALRGWYAYPLIKTLGAPSAVTLLLGGARLTGPGPGYGVEISAGAGINLFGPLELSAAVGVRIGVDGFPTEPLLAVILRPGSIGAGLDVRAQWTLAGPAFFVGADLAPFFLPGLVL